MMNFSVFILLMALLIRDASESKLLRRKRDFFDEIGAAVAKLTAPLVGSKQTVQNNDPIVGQPNLNNIGAHGVENEAKPKAPSIVQSVGVCKDNAKQCEYMECLAHNFKNSDNANNLREGTKVMADPVIREAITNDPQVAKIACEKANLDESGCNGFKQLMGLVNKLDPKSAHTFDEPREKRSPDYYDQVKGGSKSGSSGSSSSSASKTKGASSGGSSSSSSGSSGKSGGSKKGTGTSDYYDGTGGASPKSGKSKSGGGSKVTQPPKQRDCQAILNGRPSPVKGRDKSKFKKSNRQVAAGRF